MLSERGNMNLFMLFFGLVFAIPLNLYPLVDFPKDFLGMTVAFIVSAWVLWKFSSKLYLSRLVILFALFCGTWLLSFAQSPVDVPNPFGQYYLIFAMLGVMLLFAIPTLVENFGKEQTTHLLFKCLFVSGLLVAALSLLRHYGALKHVLPWVSVDGTRLIGPWGQANLTALILALAAISSAFFIHSVSGRKGKFALLCFALFVYCGTLTGSRSWLFFVLISIVVFLYIEVRGRFRKSPECEESSREGKSYLKIFVVLVGVSLISPLLDSQITRGLSSVGFLERASAIEVLDSRSNLESTARLDEWSKVISSLDASDNIWFGHGIGRYGHFSYSVDQQDSMTPHAERLWTHAHNLPLHGLVEWGVLGFFTTVALVLYLGWRFILSTPTLINASVFSMIGAIFFHNLVEFSLWYFPFYALFLALLCLVAGNFRLSVSSSWVARLSVVLLAIVLVPTGTRAAVDYYSLTRAFNGAGYSFDDQYVVAQIKGSPLFQSAAQKVDIQLVKPNPRAGKAQYKELGDLILIRPEPIFVMRRAVLAILNEDDHVACDMLSRSTRSFPFLYEPSINEILYLNSVSEGLDIDFFRVCLVGGLSQRSPSN